MVKLDPDITVNDRINNDRYNFISDMKVEVPKHTMVAKSPLVLPIKLFNKLPLSYRQIKSEKKRKVLKAKQSRSISYNILKRIKNIPVHAECKLNI